MATASPLVPNGVDRTDKQLREDSLPKPIQRKRQLGKVSLVLDEGEKTEVLGITYGLAHEIRAPGYRAKIFLDWYNRRLKVLSYKARDYEAMVAKFAFLADANKFDKIWVQANSKDWEEFLRHGYILEGLLKYANRGATVFMVSKFKSQRRIQSRTLMKEIRLIEEIMERKKKSKPKALPAGYTLDYAREEDVGGMLELYRRVFKTYPSPLTYKEYLLSNLHREAIFRVIRNDVGNVVAAASADLDPGRLSAELTDCATHPDDRGKGLMSILLAALEADLRQLNYVCAYTLARAPSYGMNAAFYSLGYEFNGRMINNCDIYGDFEDMNLWVKDLRPPKRPKARVTRLNS